MSTTSIPFHREADPEQPIGGLAADAARRQSAEEGSRRLLQRIAAYHVKQGRYEWMALL